MYKCKWEIILCILLLMTAMPLTSASASENQDPRKQLEEAYKRGDYSTAFKIAEPLAQQGNAEMQFALGFMYKNGRGVQQNNNEAIKWYTLSANQGYLKAQHNLGLIYYEGKIIPQDYNEAYKWFKLAADGGHKPAKEALNVVYPKVVEQMAAKERIAKEVAAEKKARETAEKEAARKEARKRQTEKSGYGNQEQTIKENTLTEADVLKIQDKYKDERFAWKFLKLGMTMDDIANLLDYYKMKHNLRERYKSYQFNLRYHPNDNSLDQTYLKHYSSECGMYFYQNKLAAIHVPIGFSKYVDNQMTIVTTLKDKFPQGKIYQERGPGVTGSYQHFIYESKDLRVFTFLSIPGYYDTGVYYVDPRAVMEIKNTIEKENMNKKNAVEKELKNRF